MAFDTVWDTAESLLASLNAYRRGNSQKSITSADHRVPEPTLVWVASMEGMVIQTWSIPLRLFESTLSNVQTPCYQVEYRDVERRILALKLKPLKDLRTRSGSVKSSSPLVSFLYTLMRDHLTPGEVEAILQEEVETYAGKEVEYSNGWLANYAKDIAQRLV
jgi:hypothetical protein